MQASRQKVAGSMGQTGQAEKAGTILTGHAGIKTKGGRQHGSDRTGGKGRHTTDRPCRHQDTKSDRQHGSDRTLRWKGQ